MKRMLWIMQLKDKTGYYYSPGIIWWYSVLENMGYECNYYSYEKYDIEDLYKRVKEYKPDFIMNNLMEAVKWVLKEEQKS